MEIHLLYSEEGDWVGLYIDGLLAEEGHSLSPFRVVQAISKFLDITLTVSEEPEEFFEGGRCPATYEQVHTA